MIVNILVSLRVLKGHTTYKGRYVSKFPHDFEAFMLSYKLVIAKKSILSASRRTYVKAEVRRWLVKNKIDIVNFDKELTANGQADN